MKEYVINGKRNYRFFFSGLMIALGYNKSEMDWGKGHITVFKTYFLLFWQLRITQSFTKIHS